MESIGKYVLAGVTFALVLTAALVGASLSGLLGVKEVTTTKYLTSTATVFKTLLSTKVITSYITIGNTSSSSTSSTSSSTTTSTTTSPKAEELEPLLVNVSAIPGVKVVSSYNELVKLINESRTYTQYGRFIEYIGLTGGVIVAPRAATVTVTPLMTPSATPVPLAATVATKAELGAKVPYSKTNIQVVGVDEPDVVKTDGKYIYLVKGREVLIIKAYPPTDMKLVDVIKVSNGYVKGVFVSNGKLIVIAVKYGPPITRAPSLITKTVTRTVTIVEVEDGVTKTRTQAIPVTVVQPKPIPPIPPTYNTSVYVYKVVNGKAELVGNVTVSGYYVTARMMSDNLYLIAQMPTFIIKGFVPLPYVGNVKVPPTSIIYFGKRPGYTFTTILALNTDNMKYRATVLMLGRSSRVYVSTKNIYILSTTYIDPWTYMYKELMSYLTKYMPPELAKKVNEALKKNLPPWRLLSPELLREINKWFNSLPESRRESIISDVVKFVNKRMSEIPTQRTRIYRFEIDGLKVIPKAEGEVPGVVLDQFSMDEYNGYFRIATTVTKYKVIYSVGELRWRFKPETYNNVYVLNMNLSIVGKLEKLAIGERVYAARYLGNLMYLVTYRRVDPLFGIDLSDPKHPKVLGFLKIPGYSEYLHPYMNNKYLIGIGVADTREGRGIKVTLFDIRDPKNIKVVSEVIVRDAYWSPLFANHRAFLMNTKEGYIAFPIYGKVPGLVLIGLNGTILKYKGIIPEYGCYRGLYIGNTIYAISYNMIKAVNSSTLKTVATLNIGEATITYTTLKR